MTNGFADLSVTFNPIASVSGDVVGLDVWIWS
jgi:hypothetical protein